MDYKKYHSVTARNSAAMPLRMLYEVYTRCPPGTITLTAGLPAEITFPVTGISLTLSDGSEISLDEDEMMLAQQYTGTKGLPEYRSLIHDLVRTLHQPPCWGREDQAGTVVIPTGGDMDGCTQVLHALLNPGDSVLVEEFASLRLLATVRQVGAVPVPVSMDEHGLVPESLQCVLATTRSSPGASVPKLLVVMPTGHNPTGCTYSEDRKRQIYEIARDNDLLIYEDDPYFFITFNERAPSFLSLDTDGRVVRTDSFSVSVAPGLQGGYVSGPAGIVDKVCHGLDGSTTGTGVVVQQILVGLLRHWGIEGFIRRGEGLARLYQSRRDTLVSLLERHLPGRVEYHTPESGHYMWLRVLGDSPAHTSGQQALAVPGAQFCAAPSESCGRQTPYLRLDYGHGSTEELEQVVRELADRTLDV